MIIHQPNIYSEVRERSKRIQIKIIQNHCDQHVSFLYQLFVTTVPHKSHQLTLTHLQRFPLGALVGAGELVSLFAAEPELERGHGTSKRNFFTSQKG